MRLRALVVVGTALSSACGDDKLTLDEIADATFPGIEAVVQAMLPALEVTPEGDAGDLVIPCGETEVIRFHRATMTRTAEGWHFVGLPNFDPRCRAVMDGVTTSTIR